MIDLKTICSKLNKQVCKTHKEKPVAKVTGKTIKITACCAAFTKQLEKQVQDAVSNQVDKKIDDIFKQL